VGAGEGCGAGAAPLSDSLGVLISKVTFPELALVVIVRVRTVVSSCELRRFAYAQADLARFLAELSADLVEFFVTKPVHTSDSARGDSSTKVFISNFCLLESAADVPEKDDRVFWLVVKSDKTWTGVSWLAATKVPATVTQTTHILPSMKAFCQP
jgi:hypothetical protein